MILGVLHCSTLHRCALVAINLYLTTIFGIRYLGTEPLLEKMAHERPYIKPSARAIVEELRSLRREMKVHHALEQGDNKPKMLLRAQPTRVLESGCVTDCPIEQDLARTVGLVQYSSIDGTSTQKRDVGAQVCRHSTLAQLLCVFCTVPSSQCQQPNVNMYVSAAARLYFSYSGSGALKNVDVTINAPVWVYTGIPLHNIPSIEPAAPLVLLCTFFARATIPPASMRVSATAKYLNQESHLRCASVSFPLPMPLACRVRLSQPPRNAVFKLTLDTNREAVFTVHGLTCEICFTLGVGSIRRTLHGHVRTSRH